MKNGNLVDKYVIIMYYLVMETNFPKKKGGNDMNDKKKAT